MNRFALCLPIADRPRSYAFYQAALGLKPVGDEIAEDGIPEPLQFALADDVNLMLIPTGGFGWVTPGRETAAKDVSECLCSINVASAAEVDAAFERALDHGAESVSPPTQQPWGYSATFADLDGHLWSVGAHKALGQP
ncbi:VOC family protein [Kribbella sp. NBC_01245]|uniref:VOC family protein n=1 Tax=Kribbella sp. NBC_01245 TaxID=2903578 RepID=UPI002E27D7DF|nr:VOC family protein [Kribbella sp. NBC_01245]